MSQTLGSRVSVSLPAIANVPHDSSPLLSQIVQFLLDIFDLLQLHLKSRLEVLDTGKAFLLGCKAPAVILLSHAFLLQVSDMVAIRLVRSRLQVCEYSVPVLECLASSAEDILACSVIGGVDLGLLFLSRLVDEAVDLRQSVLADSLV